MEVISDELINEINKYIKIINKNKEYGFDLELKDFIKSMSIIKPQSYGKRIENRIIKDFSATSVNSSEDKGDMLYNDNYYEIKISLLTETNKDLNLVQIRLWQKIDYYLCIAFDIRNLDDFKMYTFLLTKEEMENEMKLLNASSAHGTKKALKENKNIELRYSLKIDRENNIFKRWKEKYSKNYENLIKPDIL